MATQQEVVRWKKEIGLGIDALRGVQRISGAWEGEVVWCPMLAAQYVLMSHRCGFELGETRKQRILLHFKDTRLQSGLWGLHAHSEPYLFTTALVYVAARLLGEEADSSLLIAAREFFRREGGVQKIPSWGKFWLAMLNLYEWDGVNPVAPEVWALPKSFPLHPSRYYCHTRLIYLAMATIYASKSQHPIDTKIKALRSELYPGRVYDAIDFRRYRSALRFEDLYQPPSPALRLMYRALVVHEKHLPHPLRQHLVKKLLRRIRWEMRSTNHTCISPVNGLLNMIALFLHDPRDEDLRKAYATFDEWMWQDDTKGLRVAGARSATWDTSFVIQALAEQPKALDEQNQQMLVQATTWLKTQQIKETFGGFREQDRLDPKGGFCFAGVWHGWPVSDCSAEAVSALYAIEPEPTADTVAQIEDAIRFILRCQNPDGGFGSYEERRVGFSLEWLNPAEMFGDSMTEMSYVECSSSCAISLCEYLASGHDKDEGLVENAAAALERAAVRVASLQREDGSFAGNWGVHFIYGTLFAIRALSMIDETRFAAEIKRATSWLLSVQRKDGSWGEGHEGCVSNQFTPAEGHPTQTGWALMALCAAKSDRFRAIERGAQWLARTQNEEGEWPSEQMLGVFFHSALLDYRLYRYYFPLWGLSFASRYLEERDYRSRAESVSIREAVR